MDETFLLSWLQSPPSTPGSVQGNPFSSSGSSAQNASLKAKVKKKKKVGCVFSRNLKSSSLNKLKTK